MSATQKIKVPNIDSFNAYLDSCKDDVQTKRFEGYYPVDVVAEAYTKGFSDGEKSREKDFLNSLISKEIETFVQKANQIYILSKNLISHLERHNFKAKSLHINLSLNRPSVIISLANEFLNNDDCVKIAYSKINENRKIYSDLFNEHLDIGLVANDNLNKKLLIEDGFGYQEEYQ